MEILGFFIKLALEDSPSESYYHNLLALRLVSSKWAMLIPTTPGLWRQIPSNLPHDITESIIERSKNVMVDIHADIPLMNGENRQSLLQLGSRCRSLYITIDSAKPNCAEFFSLSTPRLTSLVVKADKRHGLEPATVPEIESLPELFSGSNPRLEVLKLEFFRIPVESINTDGLIEVDLRNTPFSVIDVIQLLSRTPRLASLRLSGTNILDPPGGGILHQHVQLPYLTKLVLDIKLTQALGLLNHIDAKNLRHFTFHLKDRPVSLEDAEEGSTLIDGWSRILRWTIPMSWNWKSEEWTVTMECITFLFEGPMSVEYRISMRSQAARKRFITRVYEKALEWLMPPVRSSLKVLVWEVDPALFSFAEDLLRLTGLCCQHITTLKVLCADNITGPISEQTFPKVRTIEVRCGFNDDWLSSMNYGRERPFRRVKALEVGMRDVACI